MFTIRLKAFVRGTALTCGLALAATVSAAQGIEAPPEQQAEYEAEVPKTIVELQPWRHQQVVSTEDGSVITLTNLNPVVNATFLLERGDAAFHIQNPDPKGQQVSLVGGNDPALVITGPDATFRCPLGPEMMQNAQASDLPFAPICEGQLYLRNAIPGSSSNLENVTDFLRDHVWGGEQIVRVVRDTLLKDQYAETSDLVTAEADIEVPDGPRPAQIEPRYAESAIAPIGFGITLAMPEQKQMIPGAWYPVAGLDGVFASAIQPRTIAAEVFASGGNANGLDSIEGRAVDYFVAFDIDRYGIGFALGTDHPRLNWSPRPSWQARIPGLPGPDGIDTARPLVRSGMVSPEYAAETIATFTAGFKRQHGAFKYGDFAGIDTGKHYGFIEQGVIYSKLKTELSTLFVLDDGTIGMKTWTEADNALLSRVVFARQNGVPLVVSDPDTQLPMPGDRVNKWGPGNWSGSANAELRTLRAGACVQEHEGRRYLVYGYFSTATPSAMARTFQAYGCSYAMLLDMNALEHTYLALYPRHDGTVHVEHLIATMSQFDKPARDGTVIPRFLGYPDNRDLFFIYERRDRP